ncbi:Murein DD-endopeptidase MepM [Erythrobacter sp. THAF29]|nr:Murein DD-endopeptidase MepM [Erythrobacter sp. THAF29]
MRSQGQVRFIKISSKFQMAGAGAVAAFALVWATSMGVMAFNKYQAEASLASFQDEKARVATAQERLKAYGDNLDAVAEDLMLRQDIIEQVTESLPSDIKSDSNVSDSSTEAAEMVEKVSAYFPQASALAKIEARQLAYVERVTRFADDRAKKAEAALRKLGLDPKQAIRKAEREAMGGPLEMLASSAHGEVDPRFERLGLSLARMSALERILDGVPQVVPAANQRITSSFGYRRDPFNGRAAMHKGIDFKGARGSPIMAAAKGEVIYAGWKAGYGKFVEISHGNGLTTRYAHMSRIDVKTGQQVDGGETLGGLGSTGRSTGPHLHFEVRINNRAVNPRPFLETAPDVLKEVRGTGSVRSNSPSSAE